MSQTPLPDLAAREALLARVADGEVALRDVGMLSASDVFGIARVGAAAMQGGRFAQAAGVFSALCALEPKVSLHRLHLALAHQGANDVAAALLALDEHQRIVAIDPAQADSDEGARALLLRAELLGRTDRDAALQALVAARALRSPAAVAVVDAALGRR